MVHSHIRIGNLLVKSVDWIFVSSGLEILFHWFCTDLLHQFDPEENDVDVGLPTRDSEEYRYAL